LGASEGNFNEAELRRTPQQHRTVHQNLIQNTLSGILYPKYTTLSSKNPPI
jgi:hypothetical protein